MIDIDAEFRKAVGTMNAVNGADSKPEPLTMKKLEQLMSSVGLPEQFKVSPESDLPANLSLRDAGEYMTSLSPGGHRTIAGVTIKEDPRVPVDVIVYERAGKLAKVFALTEEAVEPANTYAAARKYMEEQYGP